MDFVDLLAAICILVNASKGVSMVQLSCDLDWQSKTAFVLAHKLCEAMSADVHTGEVLDGHVEVDGAYFGGHVRPAYRPDNLRPRPWLSQRIYDCSLKLALGKHVLGFPWCCQGGWVDPKSL